MPTLNMNGPYDLTYSEIDNIVTLKEFAGNYALGFVDKAGAFYVHYVGRSDTDIAFRLKKHVYEEKYPKFMYSYANSVKEAFEKECRNYHDFGGAEVLDNEIHPDKPEGTNYRCPICGK